MKSIKKSPLAVSLFGVLVALTAVLAIVGLTGSNNRDDVLNSSAADPGPTGVLIESEEGKKLNYVGVAGESVLDTLMALADVETDSFNFGEFAVSINSVVAVEGVNFWALYINGDMATVGADNYIAEEGDLIEWRLEAIEL